MEAEICALAPSNWQIRSVEDVCKRVTSGGTPRRIRPDYYVNGSWPWVKTQELKDTWIEHTEERITDEAVANSSAKVLPQNTILLAMYGATVGQLGILRSPMTCNQACCAMIVNSDKADFRYLYHQLRYSRTQLKNLATGAAQQNLSGTVIKSLRYPFPPLPTQRAIAHVLGSLDDMIEMNRETNEILEEMARALFKSWFVDFDPVRAKLEDRPPAGMDAATAALFPDHFQDSELGQIPMGWEVVTVGDLATLKGGTQLEKESFFDHGTIPIFGGAGVMGHGELYNADGFVISVGRVGAYCGQYFYHRGKAWINNNASLIRQREEISGEWLLLCLRNINMEVIKKGAAQPFVSNSDIAAVKVLLPSHSILDRFQDMIRPVFLTIESNQTESRDLANLRDTLLPKLLSGEISAPAAEELIAAST
jgi:type I restriction enzyme S subunit